jgi:hypothetical protein
MPLDDDDDDEDMMIIIVILTIYFYYSIARDTACTLPCGTIRLFFYPEIPIKYNFASM